MSNEHDEWERHREAMRIIGEAIRNPIEGQRLGDLLTPAQLELVAMAPVRLTQISCTHRHGRV